MAAVDVGKATKGKEEGAGYKVENADWPGPVLRGDFNGVDGGYYDVETTDKIFLWEVRPRLGVELKTNVGNQRGGARRVVGGVILG